MCLVLLSFDENASHSLLVAANRDEFFERPSAPAHYWQDHPQVLAGRDLVGKGTWLGVTSTGRFATVTNVREPGVTVENPLSRGDLTRNFLAGDQSPEEYLLSIEAQKMRYSGFNLLVGEFSNTTRELFYLSNRQDGIKRLSSGIYGLSNHLLDSHWPKVDNGKDYLRSKLNDNSPKESVHHSLRAFLEDPSLADDDVLPKTGVSYEREKALSAAFISVPNYGTRTSTVVSICDEEIQFSEKNYTVDNADIQSKEHNIEMFTIQGNKESEAISR